MKSNLHYFIMFVIDDIDRGYFYFYDYDRLTYSIHFFKYTLGMELSGTYSFQIDIENYNLLTCKFDNERNYLYTVTGGLKNINNIRNYTIHKIDAQNMSYLSNLTISGDDIYAFGQWTISNNIILRNNMAYFVLRNEISVIDLNAMQESFIIQSLNSTFMTVDEIILVNNEFLYIISHDNAYDIEIRKFKLSYNESTLLKVKKIVRTETDYINIDWEDSTIQWTNTEKNIFGAVGNYLWMYDLDLNLVNIVMISSNNEISYNIKKLYASNNNGDVIFINLEVLHQPNIEFFCNVNEDELCRTYSVMKIFVSEFDISYTDYRETKLVTLPAGIEAIPENTNTKQYTLFITQTNYFNNSVDLILSQTDKSSVSFDEVPCKFRDPTFNFTIYSDCYSINIDFMLLKKTEKRPFSFLTLAGNILGTIAGIYNIIIVVYQYLVNKYGLKLEEKSNFINYSTNT